MVVVVAVVCVCVGGWVQATITAITATITAAAAAQEPNRSTVPSNGNDSASGRHQTQPTTTHMATLPVPNFRSHLGSAEGSRLQERSSSTVVESITASHGSKLVLRRTTQSKPPTETA